MNLIDETEPLHVKVLIFLGVMVPSVRLTLHAVLKSGPLSEFIDAMANERLSRTPSWSACCVCSGRRAMRTPCRGRRANGSCRRRLGWLGSARARSVVRAADRV